MRGVTKRRPSGSMIVAVVALVAAIAGTAIAAPVVLKLDKKEKKQVTKIARKEANKRITTRASSLTVQKATTADSATNATTAGTASAVAVGSVTSAGLAEIKERSASVDIADGAGDFAQVQCEPTEQVISGGTTTSGVGLSDGWSTIRSGPTSNGWDAAARNETGSAGTLQVKVLCLSAQ